MSEQALWRQQFQLFQSKHQLSNEFVYQMNSIINSIRTSKKKKKQIISNSKNTKSLTRFTRNTHVTNALNKATDQLEIELIEKNNLQRILASLDQVVLKSKNQNYFLEQQLKFFQKDSETLTNINRLMVREVSSLNQKIDYYNQQIDQAWTSRIKKGFKPPSPVEKEVEREQKRVSITVKVQEQVRKKPRVTFPQFFVQQCGFSSQDGSSEDEIQKQQSKHFLQQQVPFQDQIQSLTPSEPQTPPFSKYELKTALSYMQSIYRLPSHTQFSDLTREQIAIYTKSKIMSYFQASFKFDQIQSIILMKYSQLKQNIQHRQEQYLLLQQSKKELQQKLWSLEVINNRKKKKIQLDNLFELKSKYQKDTNTIIMLIIHLQRMISRYLSIIKCILKILDKKQQFNDFKIVFNSIQQNFVKDQVRKLLLKNLNRVQYKDNVDRISYLFLNDLQKKQNDENRIGYLTNRQQRIEDDKLKINRIKHLTKFYFTRYNQIFKLIKTNKIKLNLNKRQSELSKKNLDTYYIQTPDYYRIDNFRITEKLEKKLWRNMMATTTRIDRKQIQEQIEQINKTEIKTQRSLLLTNREVERIHTDRKPRSTVNSDNRMRIQKTMGNAMMLSNIVKKIGRMNRPLSTFRLSK